MRKSSRKAEKSAFLFYTLTSTTFTDGEFGTIYRSSTYDADGNNLIIETDARGNTTTYTVDPETSRNTEVTDRCGNKTAYEYDASGKTAKVTSKKADGTELANVSYSYDTFDNMTEIVRGDGMKYVLGYNAFHELETIGVEGTGTSLIRYDYKNGNGRLKSMTYANGDKMKATYNALGQMTAETWYDSDNTVTAKYKYAYDTEGNIVRSIDIPALKEYDYIYDNGKLIRAVEYDIAVGINDTVCTRTAFNNVFYTYDSEGNMTKKRIVTADGHEQVIYYEHPESSEDVVKFTLPDVLGGVTKELDVTSHSKTDSFGRKVFDELQFSTATIGRRFDYYTGKITSAHDINDKIKSTPTTQLVEEIVISSTHPYEDDRIIRYEYDNEERITKITDSVDGITEYEYDGLGQLISEIVNDEEINVMVYDGYGNITNKNRKAYVYDTVWKDKLISYDGQPITYDAQGNPTSYLGHTLAWEKGRQLMSYDNFTYTYNANGIRTSKTVNGEVHKYDLEGTKILRESWTDAYGTDHVIVPLYDNDDTVCGITYNNTTYFFVKNLQGDIIALLDTNGKTVVRYRYDAWGNLDSARDENDLSISPNVAHIANINPFRYRGYYYDNEIGLYYLQSRYYDPKVGRFVCGDDAKISTLPDNLLLHNLFTYCNNNPTKDNDITGTLAAQLIARIILGMMLGIFIQVLCDIIESWYKTLVLGSTYSRKIYPGDYISSALSWSLVFVSSPRKILRGCLAALPYVVKMAGRIINGSYSVAEFLIDLVHMIFSILVSVFLGTNKAPKGKLRQMKNLFSGSKYAARKISTKSTKLVLKMNKWGFRLSVVLNISVALTQLLYTILIFKPKRY